MSVAAPDAPAADRFTDDEVNLALRRAMRVVLLLAAVGAVAAWAWLGWRSALLLLIGAAVSASGLWEWRRLTAALAARMQIAEPLTTSGSDGAEAGKRAPNLGAAIGAFLLRLCLLLPVLYVSLRYLNGSAIALAAGLAMGVAALTFEGLRLLRNGLL